MDERTRNSLVVQRVTMHAARDKSTSGLARRQQQTTNGLGVQT